MYVYKTTQRWRLSKMGAEWLLCANGLIDGENSGVPLKVNASLLPHRVSSST